MTGNLQEPHQFYNAKNFYSLHSSAGAVWLTCVVVGGLFTSLTPLAYRCIALGLSLAIAVGLTLMNRAFKSYTTWLLLLFNSVLIFVNASGINAVVNNLTFEKEAINQKEKKEAKINVASFLYQKSWWPDAQLKYDVDSLRNISEINEAKISRLRGQFAFIDDWIAENIKDTASRRKLQNLFILFGHYDEYPTRLSKELAICNTRFDSLNIAYNLFRDQLVRNNPLRDSLILSKARENKFADSIKGIWNNFRESVSDFDGRMQGMTASRNRALEQVMIDSFNIRALKDSIEILNRKIKVN